MINILKNRFFREFKPQTNPTLIYHTLENCTNQHYSTITSLTPKPTFTPLSTFTSPPSQYSKGIRSVNTLGRHVSSVQVTKLKLTPASEWAGAPSCDGTLTTICISFRLVPLLGTHENVGLGKVTIHLWGASGVSFRPLTNCTSTSRRILPPLGLICMGLSRL